MRASILAKTIRTCIELRRPLLIEGSPGLGKTQIPVQVAKEMGLPVILFHGPTMQPEDIAIPAPNGDRTALEFMPNGRFPLEGSDCPDEGLILIDELAQADLPVQKGLAHLIQEGDIHGRKLKPGWAFICTGNRAKDRAGANRILSHLGNRLTRVEFEPNLDDWCEWANKNGVRPEVVQFVRFKPDQLNNFDPKQDLNATPRAWVEGVSPLIDKIDRTAEFECYKGAVGEGAATEFSAFLKICRDLPDPDTILKNPAKAEVPNKSSTLFALAGAIAHRADEKNFEAVMTYARRMPPEFTVMVILDSAGREPKVQSTKAFADWVIKEGKDVML